jgi:superfamily II DNA or RNA helicase
MRRASEPIIDDVNDQNWEGIQVIPPLNDATVHLITDRLDGYSAFDPYAAHLRPHQIEAVEAFRHTGLQLIDGSLPHSGMGIIHPTGSGKSVIGAELIRMVCVGAARAKDIPLSALWLTPRHTISGQITGDERGIGMVQQYVPRATVGEYSGWRQEMGRDVTVMTYHSLPKAIKSGDLAEINPALIICDEIHHAIDGAWARGVKAAGLGRLLVGLTATPDYSDRKNISGLFKHELVRKTMRQGIEEGILSELEGHLYKGSSVIEVKQWVGGDFSDEDLFEAISDSEDNYLAAKLATQEIEAGRRGVIACVPGHDRAHAKIMREILNRLEVQVDGARRLIRAEYVGGELSRKELNKILNDYKNGLIDVLCQVDLLTEGWDSPETDFLISMRPTTSKVLAAQRLGRILRPRKGKTASVHEFVYDVYGSGASQVTYDEILDGRSSVEQQFHTNNPNSQKSVQRFHATNFNYDPELPQKVAKAEIDHRAKVAVETKPDVIPYNWLTPELAAVKAATTVEAVYTASAEAGLVPRELQVGEVNLKYYPPEIMTALIRSLGILPLPKTYISLDELTRYHKEISGNPGLVTSRGIELELAESGHELNMYDDGNGNIVRAYHPSAKKVIVNFYNTRDASTGSEVHIPSRAKVELSPLDVYEWLVSVLVHPDDPNVSLDRHVITAAQRYLVEVLKNQTNNVPHSAYLRLQTVLESQGVAPTEQMLGVMKAKNISFGHLVSAAAATKAKLIRSGLIAA